MIMPRGQQLLLPVNPLFIVVTLVIGLAVNMLPLGRIVWLPDMLLLLLAFWSLNQPQRVGLGIAFALGLVVGVLGMLPGWWSRRKPAPRPAPHSDLAPLGDERTDPPHGV